MRTTKCPKCGARVYFVGDALLPARAKKYDSKGTASIEVVKPGPNGLVTRLAWKQTYQPHKCDGAEPDEQPTVVVDVVFDGPPSPEGARFIECEVEGRSVSAGDWFQRDDGFWVLRIPTVLEANPEEL